MNMYERYGCKDRQEYLEMVAEDHGVDLEMVLAAADVLGPNEDFDGLISIIEDL